MMKLRHLLISVLAVLFLCSCKETQKSRPVTMMVTMGFDEEFFTTLAKDVKADLGIDIEYVYQRSSNTSTMLLENFIHNDLHADLVFTSLKVKDRFLEESCLDFVSNTNLMSHYPRQRADDFITEDGHAYQLPLSSKLVGITYNATLMEEHGWELPRTYQDMLDLKRKCAEAGVPFAVTDMLYSGNAFNYLFHIMGSQWLSTLEGEAWLKGFLDGRKTMRLFKDKAGYFRRWVEDGMFGKLFFDTRSSGVEYSTKRALFWISHRNTVTGYVGPMKDAAGNPNGRILHDVYRSMPWISENGANNCYTLFYDTWVAADKSLAEPGHENELRNVLAVLDYMMQDKYVRIAMAGTADTYSVFGNVEPGRDRMYYEFMDPIRRGYLQPLYYQYFDDPTVIPTGTEIGSYIINSYRKKHIKVENVAHANYTYNPEATFDSAIGKLRTTMHSLRDDYLGWAEEDVRVEKVAELSAIGAGLTLQETIDTLVARKMWNGCRNVTVSLEPYAREVRDLQPWRRSDIQSFAIHTGSLNKSYSSIMAPGVYVTGILMTGARIKEIVAGGFDPSGYFTDPETGVSSFDKTRYGPYPYACVTKGGVALEDEEEYLVAVGLRAIDKDLYDSFLNAGKVVLEGGAAVRANLTHGIDLYFLKHDTVSNSNLVWE